MFGIGYQEIALILPLLWFWLVGTFLVIFVAGQKNRHPLGWGLLSFFVVGPLLALIALAAVPHLAEDQSAEESEIATRGIRDDLIHETCDYTRRVLQTVARSDLSSLPRPRADAAP